MYQQRPASDDGAVFRGDWLRGTFDASEPVRGEVCIAWDTAISDRGDYNACVVVERSEDSYLVRDAWRARCTFGRVVEQAMQMHTRYPTARIVVEKSAVGCALAQQLRAHGITRISEVVARGSKVERARSVQHIVERGDVLFPQPEEHPWVAPLLSELQAFPEVAHDDQVDAFVMALRELSATGKRCAIVVI